MRQRFLSGLLDMVAMANSQRDVPAHPLSLPKRCANLFR
jgi:hypothetical protein